MTTFASPIYYIWSLGALEMLLNNISHGMMKNERSSASLHVVDSTEYVY